MAFTCIGLALPGVLRIRPQRFDDARGFFAETFQEEAFAGFGVSDRFVQDNLSFSKQGVLRGLHFQRPPHAQAKLVRCLSGEIFDVAADFDPASPTYGQHVSARLSGETNEMLYVPARYAHGFCVLSESAFVEYKVSAFYHPECAGGVRYSDPVFSIPWPVLAPILSEQDQSWPAL